MSNNTTTTTTTTVIQLWKQRLAEGEPVVESKEQWQAIHTALKKHKQDPKHYVLSSETGLLEIDSNVLLQLPSTEIKQAIDDTEAAIKTFNEFVTNLQTLSIHLMHKVNLTLEANAILRCMKCVRSISTRKLEHNKQGYRCAFTGETHQTNLLVQIIYYEDKEGWQKSSVFSVTERYYVFLKALYMMRRFTAVLLEDVSVGSKFFDNMNAAIQWAWEFVHPVIVIES